MKMTFPCTCFADFRKRGFQLAVAAILLFITSTGYAQTTESVITIGTGIANPGDSVEIPFYISTGSPAPSSLIVFVEYDDTLISPYPDYYENIQTSGTNLLLDTSGYVITVPGAARIEEAAADADKTVSVEVHENAVGIVVTGLNTTPLGNGLLFTLAFSVSGNTTDSAILLQGVGFDNPIQIQDVPVYSSASDGAGTELPVYLVDGIVELGCTPAETPAGVSASHGKSDQITITWDAVSGSGTQYRVFRSETDDISTAVPIGDGWISGTQYADITAGWSVAAAVGCNDSGGVSSYRWYYYWVKARSAEGCESGFSDTSVNGYRNAPDNLSALINDLLESQDADYDDIFGLTGVISGGSGNLPATGAMVVCFLLLHLLIRRRVDSQKA